MKPEYYKTEVYNSFHEMICSWLKHPNRSAIKYTKTKSISTDIDYVNPINIGELYKNIISTHCELNYFLKKLKNQRKVGFVLWHLHLKPTVV